MRGGSVLTTVRRGGVLVAGLCLVAAPLTAREQRVAGAAAPPATAIDERVTATLGAAPSLRIDMPPPARQPDAARQRLGEPLRIGFHRDVPPAFRGNLLPRLEWTTAPSGELIAALLVSSPGAVSVRLGLRAKLPPGARVGFFQPDDAGSTAPAIAASEFSEFAGRSEAPAESAGRPEERAAALTWSPSVAGDVIGLQVTLPSGGLAGAWLRLERVAHRFLHSQARRYKALRCPDLHLDVQCRVGHFQQGLENAVARIAFERPDGTYLCSGTLLNDADSTTQTPYFLTANHCISTPEEARSMVATWFYQRASCGVAALDERATTVRGGGELLATSVRYDATLLKLRWPPPPGVFYAGWDGGRPVAIDDSVFGIHHPQGEPRKYSAGRVLDTRDSEGLEAAIVVTWDEGRTEGGSSGSGLFRDGYLIGTLSHGDECDADPYQDFYGSFAGFFPQVCGVLRGTGCGDGRHDIAYYARPIALGTVGEDAVDEIGDVDYWRVTVPSSGVLVAETAGNTDTVGALEDDRGRTPAQDDNGGAGKNFRIERAIRAGTHFVRVSGGKGETGNYVLRVSHTPVALPLFLAHSPGRHGFARVINRSNRAGQALVTAIDDAGTEKRVSLRLEANRTVHINSEDLRDGNDEKGLSGGVGLGEGDWRLLLETDLDVNVLAFARTADGFLTSMHDTVTDIGWAGRHRYVVPIFNPASNTRQVSKLRLFNPHGQPIGAIISGVDDSGNAASRGYLIAELPAGAARTFTAAQLEAGDEALRGSLGDGQGKWELVVQAARPIGVMNLLESPPADAGSGATRARLLTNLSTSGRSRRARSCSPSRRSPRPCEVPLFIAADDETRQGFARIINYSDEDGEVTVSAVDDAGVVAGPVAIRLRARQALHFNSDDLEGGNVAKGLSGGVGDGAGDWRLLLETELDILGPLVFVRTRDGFLTSMHDVVRDEVGWRHVVAVFNPASNANQVSKLRVVNPTPLPASIAIAGVDDAGAAGPAGEVTLQLPAGQARTFDAAQLENGAAGLWGRLGDGKGKWRLTVTADQPVRVMSLLQSPTGNLTNLSSSPQD